MAYFGKRINSIGKQLINELGKGGHGPNRQILSRKDLLKVVKRLIRWMDCCLISTKLKDGQWKLIIFLQVEKSLLINGQNIIEIDIPHFYGSGSIQKSSES